MDSEINDLDADQIGFDPSWYLNHNPDVAKAVQAGEWTDAWQHFMTCGWREGRLAGPPPTPIATDQLIDEPDLVPFLEHGEVDIDTGPSTTTAATGLDADEIGFDPFWYLTHNTDVARAVRDGEWSSAWEHFVKCGRREGRLANRPRLAIESDRAGYNSDSVPFWEHNEVGFLTPEALKVTATTLTRVAMIGSCTLEAWGLHARNASKCPVDLIVTNNLGDLPQLPDDVLASYDFVVLQIPLRDVLHDDAMLLLDYSDLARHEAVFEHAIRMLDFHLGRRMLWNRENGLLTFVANFFLPQFNPMGRLFPRYDLRNPEYFIDRLNEYLERAVRAHRNAYVLDVDRLSASIGRRFVQDDSTTLFGHNGLMPYDPPNSNRIEPMPASDAHYDIRWPAVLPQMIWAELLAMYRTIQQTDPIKLVIVDLDDTLWHGISGDLTEFDYTLTAGWPIGIAEALWYLKRRGVLLAIVSKNEESRIREIWPLVYARSLRLEDFAAIRINWLPKAENIREILEGMNLLPRNVLFIDDNPAERESVRQAFPEIRVLGRYPLYVRRILLCAPETQVTTITDESARRTEMIQAQFTRESERRQLSREEFLRSAAPRVTLMQIGGGDHPRFARVFELINKTNQFNTTGKRWKPEEMDTFFKTGGKIIAFEAADRFTQYGLVGVVMSHDDVIEQWVMSCRILGYQIEEAVMAHIVARMRATAPGALSGLLIHTDANFPCRDLFRRCGFTMDDETTRWVLPADATVVAPDHVELKFVASSEVAATEA